MLGMMFAVNGCEVGGAQRVNELFERLMLRVAP